jgi:hypothetical protein
MLGIYLKDIVEDEQGQEQDVKCNDGKIFEPIRIRRNPTKQTMIEMAKQTPKSDTSPGGFDILPKAMRRDSNQLGTLAGNALANSLLKKSLIGTRFEALGRTRHNFSLVSNTARNYHKSNSIILTEKPVHQIEYKLPKEPESNRNKASDMASFANDGTPKEINEEDEYPEVQVEEVCHTALPLTTEIAEYVDLPKIKVIDMPSNNDHIKSPLSFARMIQPPFDSRKAKKEERKYSLRDLPSTPKASF